MSLAEPFLKPSTMLYRNFLAMESEELLRSHPIDGAVLMGGCDKTTPGLIMGAISMGIPAIYMPAGPMLRGNWRGKALGSGSDAWKYWDENARRQDHRKRLGRDRTRHRALARPLHDDGHRLDHDRRRRGARHGVAGRGVDPGGRSRHPRWRRRRARIVDMVWEDLTPSDLITADSIHNAVSAVLAIGGSTNAIMHLIALARRAGLELDMEAFDRSRGRCR